MRRSRGASPPSPFRALAHHHAQHVPGRAGESVSSMLRSFNVETNPTRPMRPSPLTASTIPDMPLDLVDRIRSFPLFVSAPDEFLAAIGKHLRPQIHAPHDHILTEGDDAKAMYWVVRGAVAVTSRDGEAVYAELKPGAFFGEIGVLMDMPRTATIIARTKCLLVVLKKEDLQTELPRFPDMEKAIRQEAQERLVILKKKQQERRYPDTGLGGEKHEEGTVINSKKRKSPSPGVIEDPAIGGSALGSGYVNVRKTLKELPLFSALPADILHFLGLSAQPKTYSPFTDIIRQGSHGNDIFFIVSGEAEVIHELVGSGVGAEEEGDGDDENSGDGSFARPRLTQGQYFGEVASLGLSPGQVRTATVRSITSVECLMISGEALDELWRRCPPGLKSQVEETARQRYRKGHTDVEMSDVGSAARGREPTAGANEEKALTPLRRHSVPHMTFTTPSKPSSPTMEKAEMRQPSDPDPFLSVDMENLRNRRRNSLAPPTPATVDGQAPAPGEGGSNTGGINSINTSSPLKLFTFPPLSAPAEETKEVEPVELAEQDPVRGRFKKARTLTHRPYSDDCSGSPVSPHSAARTRLPQAGQQGPPTSVLVGAFQLLGIVELIRLRAVCREWKRVLTTSPQLCRRLDLSTVNRFVNDWSLSQVIAPFVGQRAEEVDIGNCFHITDEGFQALWRQCGRNVRTWRMQSVWDVSANQILDMSENAKGLEEVDWSNCRKVGDNLLARVVGWVVPVPAAETKTVISSSKAQAQRPGSSRSEVRVGPAPGTVIGCPRLSVLDLSYCKHITDRSMLHLAAHASGRLRSLTLTRCTSVTDGGFQAWAPYRFRQLTHLCLADCTYLSDSAIVALVNAAKGLTHLDLSFCCALSDTATEVVALGLPRLQDLRLAFCGSAVSDASLRCIALHLNDLRGLSVRGCVRVTGAGLEHVLDGCARLDWVDVSQCKNLSVWIVNGGVARWGYDDRESGGSIAPSLSSRPGWGLSAVNRGAGLAVTAPLPSMRGQRRRARRPVRFIIEKGADGGLR